MDPDSPQPIPPADNAASTPVAPATPGAPIAPDAPSDASQDPTAVQAPVTPEPTPAESPATPDPIPTHSTDQTLIDSTPTADIHVQVTPITEPTVPNNPVVAPPLPVIDFDPTPPVSALAAPVSESTPSLSSPIAPNGITPELSALFQSWLTTYQRSFQSQGTQGLMQKKQKHLDRVVELAAERGSVTRQELQLAMRLSASTVEKYIHALATAGRIKHVGLPHEGRYGKVG